MVHFKILFTKSISNIPYPPQASDVLQILHWASVMSGSPRTSEEEIEPTMYGGRGVGLIWKQSNYPAAASLRRSFRIPANLGSNRTYYG